MATSSHMKVCMIVMALRTRSSSELSYERMINRMQPSRRAR